MDFPIGVIVDSFKVPIKEAIVKAKEVGASGIQIYAVSGEMAPDNLNAKKRKEWLDHIQSQDLRVTALVGDPGDGGFGYPEKNQQRIEFSKKVIDLALDLDTNIVTTHIGVIPNDDTHDRYKIMQEACEQIGEYAAQNGAYFAIETGPEPSSVLKGFLDRLHTRNVCVNFDPANLVMVIGEDPLQAVDNLKEYIVHTHAKDGKMLKKCDPEDLYLHHTANWKEAFIETPLGEGDVDFYQYLNILNHIGYTGYLTIEREVGETPYQDIKEAVVFLKNIIMEVNKS